MKRINNIDPIIPFESSHYHHTNRDDVMSNTIISMSNIHFIKGKVVLSSRGIEEYLSHLGLHLKIILDERITVTSSNTNEKIILYTDDTEEIEEAYLAFVKRANRKITDKVSETYCRNAAIIKHYKQLVKKELIEPFKL